MSDDNGFEGTADLGGMTMAPPAPPGSVAAEVVDALAPLPTIIEVTASFMNRMPSQRFLDEMKKFDPRPYVDLAREEMPRITAFRKFMRDYPDRDPASMWLHAYDVEVEIIDEDPTFAPAPRPSPPSVPTGI